MMAGFVYSSGPGNVYSYLYTNKAYWTFSPTIYNTNPQAFMMTVTSAGGIYDSGYVVSTFGLRPVINLSSNVTVTGEGTATDPYRVL